MERVKLFKDKGSVITFNGKHLFLVAMTDRAIELSQNEGWDKDSESWFAYRNRTEKERLSEERKRDQMASDLVGAYNDRYELS